MSFISYIHQKIYQVLRFFARMLGVDVIYFAESGFWLVLRRIVSIASAFLIAVAFANLLSKEVYGMYKYILSVITILSSLTLSGMNAAVNQSVANGYERNLITGYSTKIRWNLLASAIGLTLAVYYAFLGEYHFASAYAFFAFTFPIFDASSLFDDYLQGKASFKLSAQRDMLQQTAITIVLLGALFLLPKEAFVLVIVLLGVQTFFSVWYYRQTIRSIPQDAELDTDALRYAKHLSFINILATVANQIENILLFKIGGAAQLAVYSFATALPEQIKGVLANIGTMAFPRFVKKNIEDIRVFLKKKFIYLFGIGMIVIGLYILAAPLIYKVFFPKYQDAVFYSQLFALSMINMVLAPSTVVLQAKKKIKEQYISNIINPIFRIAITALFLFWWGILGLVIARIITRIAGSLLDYLLLLRST